MEINQKTNAIKWLAIITMTIDHIGYYLFPSFTLLRLVGRIAFPCFLYTTVQGVKVTKDFRKYLLRMLITGLVSMPITALSGNYFNILFTLLLFSLSMKDYRLILPAAFLGYFTEYGIYGFLMGWTIYVMIEKDKRIGAGLFLLINLLQWPSLQAFAILAIIPMLVPFKIKVKQLPKLLGYAYYPLHQLVLIFLARLL